MVRGKLEQMELPRGKTGPRKVPSRAHLFEGSPEKWSAHVRPVIIAFNTSSDTCKFKDHSGGDFGWNRLVFIRRGTRAKDKNLPRTKESLSTKSFASFRFL